MTTIIVTAIVALVIVVAGYLVSRHLLDGKYRDMMEKAQKEADVIKEKKLLEVKEKFLNKKSELEKEVQQRNQKIQQSENKLKQRELQLNQRQEELGRRKQENDQAQQRIENEKKLLALKQADLEKMQEQEREKLLDTQSDYKKSLQQAQSQLAETEYEIKTIGAELREAEDEVLRRTEEKKQVERLLETVSQAEDTCRRELERFLQRSGSDEGRLSLLSGQLEGVQAELAKITAQIPNTRMLKILLS